MHSCIIDKKWTYQQNLVKQPRRKINVKKLFRKRNIRIRFRVPLEINFFQWRHCKKSKNTLRVKLFGCSPQPSINVIKLWQWLLIYYTKNAPKGAWNWEDSCVWRHILLLFIIADEVIIPSVKFSFHFLNLRCLVLYFSIM